MSVTCDACGQEWERDPALEVPCPSCPADVGERCKRPSGHPAALHKDRDRLALQVVEGYDPCPERGRNRERQEDLFPGGDTSPGQPTLFD